MADDELMIKLDKDLRQQRYHKALQICENLLRPLTFIRGGYDALARASQVTGLSETEDDGSFCWIDKYARPDHAARDRWRAKKREYAVQNYSVDT